MIRVNAERLNNTTDIHVRSYEYKFYDELKDSTFNKHRLYLDDWLRIII